MEASPKLRHANSDKLSESDSQRGNFSMTVCSDETGHVGFFRYSDPQKVCIVSISAL